MSCWATSENGSCAAVFGMLRCRNCTATSAFLQCGSHLDQKLRCSKRKTALQHRKSCVAGRWRFPAAFKPPRLGIHVSDLLRKRKQISTHSKIRNYYPDLPEVLAFFSFSSLFSFCGFPCFFVHFCSLFQGFPRVLQRGNPRFFRGDPRFFCCQQKARIVNRQLTDN